MAHLVNKHELIKAINNLPDLEPEHKECINSRWVHYVKRWDDRAAENKWKYYTLRTIVVVGAVALPALIGSAAAPTITNMNEKGTLQWFAFGLSLVVGIAAGLEELFRFGEIWRDKRAASEILQCEGWRYVQLIGKYKDKTHKIAYYDFAATVENIIEHEIKDYILVTRPKEEEKKDG